MKDLQTKTIRKLSEALDLTIHDIPSAAARPASSNQNVIAYIDSLTRLLDAVYWIRHEDAKVAERKVNNGNK